MKKLLVMFIVFAMLLTTGCSKNEEKKPEGPVTIEFWHSMGSSTGELVQEIVDEFNASQNEVVVECIYQGDYTTAGTKIQAAVASNTQPAVAQIEITRVGMYASAGQLMDLKPFDDTDDTFNASDLYPGVMDFSWYDGKLVSLPNGRSVPVLYYNVEALKAAGYDEAPKNWEEFRDIAQKTTNKDAGVTGYGLPIGDSWYYLAMCLTAGGQIYNNTNNGLGFSDGPGQKVLQLWSDMKNEGSLIMPEGEDYASNSALRKLFMAGSVAMTMQSSAQYRGLADNSSFTVGVAYIPMDTTYAAIPGGSNLVAFAGLSDEQAEAAWKFMKYMCSPEVAGKYAAGTGYLPTSEAALKTDIYQQSLAKYPDLDVAVKQLEYFVEMPFDEAYTEIKDHVVGKYVQECIINGMTPEDAVSKMATETTEFYK